MVRTYPFNPSTSTKNFTNLNVADSNTVAKAESSALVDPIFSKNTSWNQSNDYPAGNFQSNFNRQQSFQSPKDSTFREPVPLSRANSLPPSQSTSALVRRVGWIADNPRYFVRRRSNIDNRLISAANYNKPPIGSRGSSNNLHIYNGALSLAPPVENRQTSPAPIALTYFPSTGAIVYDDRDIDYVERQYLLEQQRKQRNDFVESALSNNDLKLEEMSYGGGSYNNHQQAAPNYGVGGGGDDYEKYLRNQEREQKQRYLLDLQKQAQEQKTRRLMTEIDYGGVEYERELLKQQQSNGRGGLGSNETLPPWLRGNPQPKNGLRGNNPTGSTSFLSAPNGVSGSFSNNPPALRRERSLPMDLNGFGAGGASNLYGGSASTYGLNNNNNNYNNYSNQVPAKNDEIWDPFGKGGAGAPIRDKNGKLVADRSRLQQSWNHVLDTNQPHALSPGNSMNMSSMPTGNDSLFGLGGYGGAGSGFLSGSSNNLSSFTSGNNGGQPSNEKDQYKSELQKQIEERKLQKDLEKRKEMEQDMKDRAEFEKYAEKQRQELDAEKEKQRAKQEMAQKKFETMQNPESSGQTNARVRRVSNAGGFNKRPEQKDDGLEWWERAPQNRNRPESVLIPTARSQNNNVSGNAQSSAKPPVSASRQMSSNARKPPTPTANTATSRRNSGQFANNAPSSRRQSPVGSELNRGGRQNYAPPTPPPAASYESSENLVNRRKENDASPPSMRSSKPAKPRSAAVKNEAILRQLSAMRERLNKEQIRVKSALRRREYDEDLFSDDDTAPSAEFLLKDEITDYGGGRSTLNYSQNNRSSPPTSKNRSSKPSNNNNKNNYNDLFENGKDKNGRYNNNDDDDEPPLVKLIKNSRTSASTFARTAPNSNSYDRQRRKSDDWRTAHSDDESQNAAARSSNRNRGGRTVGLSDDESDHPDQVVDAYLSKRNAGRNQSRSLGRNPRPLSTDTLY